MKEATAYLDELQKALEIKLPRTDLFDFCFWHFWRLMEFTMLLSEELVRVDETGRLKPITYQDKRELVKLLRDYLEAINGKNEVKDTTWPRVPCRHLLSSLNRTFNKHFDDLLYIATLEEKAQKPL